MCWCSKKTKNQNSKKGYSSMESSENCPQFFYALLCILYKSHLY